MDANKEGSGIDVSYWESLLSQLKAHLARARLRDKHSENLRRKLAMLKAEQNIQASSADEELPQEEEEAPTPLEDNKPSSQSPEDQQSEEALEEAEETEKVQEEEEEEGDCGYYSPVYVCEYQLDLGTLVGDEGEEAAKRRVDQSKALRGAKVETVMNAEEKALEREAKKGKTVFLLYLVEIFKISSV